MAGVRLESLRINGFKSFPDEAELSFSGFVSAIIGPNGCGKSNLVDAMLWVLGEQSPSLLRLKSMGDVVFSGAAKRQPAGSAEVVLRLRADDGRWQATEGRLEISRRVSRSGPSDYRLNGRNARLKDVMDELLGVGLGTRSYAIIEQGRVGQVLSARPIDRRILLEEAAGITRYKVRRREAELKLEHTRQNLLRLDDVIAEVERSLRQLKRQARQAERYQQAEEKLREHLQDLYTLRTHHTHVERQEIARRRAQEENEVAAAAAALASNEADLSDARKHHDRLREEVEKARSEVSGLVASGERLEAFLERSADLIDRLRESLEAARRESATISSQRTQLEEQLAEVGQRRTQMEQESTRIAERVAQEEVASEATRSQLEQAEHNAATRRKQLLRTISTLTNSRNQLGELERELDRLGYTRSQLGNEQERLGQRRTEVAARYAEAADASRTAASRVEDLEQQRRARQEERTRLDERLGEARKEAERLDHAAWEHRHRLAGVERQLARSTAALDRVATMVPAEHLAGQVSEHLHPEPEVAQMLDRVWAEWLELPVLEPSGLEQDRLRAAGGLEERTRFAIRDTSAQCQASITGLPDGTVSLLERAGIEDHDLGWLSRVLPPAFSCDDPVVARELARAHPSAVFVDADGVLWRGCTVEPPIAGSQSLGTLALRNQREQLQEEITEASTRLSQHSNHQQQLTTRLKELDDALSGLGQDLVKAEKDRAGAMAVEGSLHQEMGRLERELESLATEEQRQLRQHAELTERRSRLEEEVSSLQSRSEELEQAVEAATLSLETNREAASEALRSLDRWRAEARLADERTSGTRSENERLVRQSNNLDERARGLEAERTRLVEQLAKTEDEVVRSRARLVEDQGSLAAAREKERELAGRLEKAAIQLQRLDTELRSRRANHDEAREVLHQTDVEQTKIEGEWSQLSEAALKELALTTDQLLRLEAPSDTPQEELEEAIAALRLQLESLGPVNLLAVREVSELSERATFLKAQRKDLVEALHSLETTIAEIDATCIERFVATFEQVNLVFAQTFTHLFGGGTARLDLVDEDDPLESGIDIVAQPPGKRNQSVQLLSGGEKALTALSLLIAMFRIKPSPFCILDEVDAPLDDANVERLAELVREMSEHTQFILITHNRRTMTRADVLYGVTMEEAGVSKVVSVRLED